MTCGRRNGRIISSNSLLGSYGHLVERLKLTKVIFESRDIALYGEED
jgi:hypothetical protein